MRPIPCRRDYSIASVFPRAAPSGQSERREILRSRPAMGPMSMNYQVVRALVRKRELEGMRTAGVVPQMSADRRTQQRHFLRHVWSHRRPFRRTELRRVAKSIAVADQRASSRERRRLRDVYGRESEAATARARLARACPRTLPPPRCRRRSAGSRLVGQRRGRRSAPRLPGRSLLPVGE